MVRDVAFGEYKPPGKPPDRKAQIGKALFLSPGWYGCRSSRICKVGRCGRRKTYSWHIGTRTAHSSWVPWCKWLVQRFRSESLWVRSQRSAIFTPSAHVRRQSRCLPVCNWPPTFNKIPLLYLDGVARVRSLPTL